MSDEEENSTPENVEQVAAQQPAIDWKAKFEETLAESRKWESRAKENSGAAKKLKEIEDRDLSELDKARRDAEQAIRASEESVRELESLRRQTLVQKVALDKGLPAQLAGRLQGSTEDELSADADALLALVSKQPPPAPKPDPGQGRTGSSASGITAGSELFDQMRTKPKLTM